MYRLINGRYAATGIPQIPALIQFTRGIRAVHASFPRVAFPFSLLRNFYFICRILNFNLINFLDIIPKRRIDIYRISKSIFCNESISNTILLISISQFLILRKKLCKHKIVTILTKLVEEEYTWYT